MKNIVAFIGLILKKWVGVLTGTLLAIFFSWMPIFISDFFEKHKFMFAIVLFSLGILYSTFKVWLDINRHKEELDKILYEKYNLPKDQEEILQSIYDKGEDLNDILKQYMYVGGEDKSGTVFEGYNKADLVDDLEEDGYIKTSRNNTGIWDLECTIKGKKYIEKRL